MRIMNAVIHGVSPPIDDAVTPDCYKKTHYSQQLSKEFLATKKTFLTLIWLMCKSLTNMLIKLFKVFLSILIDHK